MSFFLTREKGHYVLFQKDIMSSCKGHYVLFFDTWKRTLCPFSKGHFWDIMSSPFFIGHNVLQKDIMSLPGHFVLFKGHFVLRHKGHLKDI